MEAIENGMVDILINLENIDFVRLTLRYNKGETRVETVVLIKLEDGNLKQLIVMLIIKYLKIFPYLNGF